MSPAANNFFPSLLCATTAGCFGEVSCFDGASCPPAATAATISVAAKPNFEIVRIVSPDYRFLTMALATRIGGILQHQAHHEANFFFRGSAGASFLCP